MQLAVISSRLLAILALALSYSQSASAAPGDLLSTDRVNVNVRSTPSTDSAIVTRINPGDMVIEIGSTADWYHVRLPAQDREGWVFAPLMTTVSNLETQPVGDQPAAAPVPQPTAETGPSLEAGSSAETERSTRTGSSSDRLLARLDRFDEDLIGDPERGEAIFAKCGSCHTTVAGIHASGPSLVGVFGQSPAAALDYRYSGGMQAFSRTGAVWDPATLDRFIQRPARIVKGTSMPFSGLRDPQDRRDVIAFLERLSR